MERVGKQYSHWDVNPRMPEPAPPAGSCDCQFHIYDDPSRVPARADAPYPPISDATFAEAQKMHAAIGFARGVIVHSAIYGRDNRLLLNALEGQSDPNRYRGVCIVDDQVQDRELERLNQAGVRAARFNFVRFLTIDQRADEVLRSMTRIRALGWHARLHVHGEDLLTHSDLLRSIRDVPMVIEHFGHIGFEGGFDRPAVRWILDMLRHENWWMMVSNGNRDSPMEHDWDDAVPYGHAFVEAAPDRTIWGSDWPHPQWPKRMMNDAETVELLYRYVDGDHALLGKVLVENPARLYDFND